MRQFHLIPISVMMLILLSASIGFGFPTHTETLSSDQWKEDLDFLVQAIKEKHRSPFDQMEPAVLEKAAAELSRQIPKLSDHQIVVKMMKLVAMLHDGHSRLDPPIHQKESSSHAHTQTPQPEIHYFRMLPLKFYWFSDGLFIRAASPTFKELAGARVVSVGGVKVEKALEKLRPVVHYDSEMWFKNLAPYYLRIAEILHAVGLSESIDKIEMKVSTREGLEKSISLGPLEPGSELELKRAYEGTQSPLPLYLQNQERTFMFEYLAERKILYTRINAIADTEEETFAQFIHRLFESVDALLVDRLVIDLRNNGGGNNYLNRSLVLHLIRSPFGKEYGRLFVVIGRRTFSAAMNLVTDLEKWTDVIFVGEPTGNSPSHYGDARKHFLPHSGLTLRLSTVYWRDWSVDEDRNWVAPDISTELSSEDFIEKRDPVMEAIQDAEIPGTLGEQLKKKFEESGSEAAFFHYYKYMTSPETIDVSAEAELIEVSRSLSQEGEISEAVLVLRQCLKQYPDSYEAYLTLGKIYAQSEKKEKAVEALKCALEIRPSGEKAKALLGKFKK